MRLENGFMAKSVGSALAQVAGFFSVPQNFFLAAGGLLIFSSATFFDGLLGLTVASIGIFYKYG